MGVRRGSVWWVDLGEPRGSAPGAVRPALVISADRFNRSNIDTVVVAAITSNTRLADAPGNVLLDLGEAGLPKASVVNVSQLVTVDEGDLLEQLGELDAERMWSVSEGLRTVLAL